MVETPELQYERLPRPRKLFSAGAIAAVNTPGKITGLREQVTENSGLDVLAVT
jgi:hypothetical protein